jgi:hypothetical protein
MASEYAGIGREEGDRYSRENAENYIQPEATENYLSI